MLWWLNDGAWPPITGIAGGIYIGLLNVARVLLLVPALKATDNTAKISNLIFLSPFISLQLIGWILGESIHLTTYAGLIVILVAIIWQQRWHAKQHEA